MFTFAAYIILALCLQVQNPTWPPMKNYQCKKCGILIKTERRPNTFNCRAGNYHDWNDLGEVGCENYRCKKCGILLYASKSPNAFDCPSGGYHQWNKMN